MLSIDLQCNINLSGQNGKISFKKHHLRNCVIGEYVRKLGLILCMQILSHLRRFYSTGAIRTDAEAITPTEKDFDRTFIKFFGGSGELLEGNRRI